MKSSPEFKENPTVLKNVVEGLQAILDKIYTLESKEVPKESRGVKEKGKKSARKLAETRILIQGANKIGELVNDFETAIARADSLDFKGPLIYNVAVEEAVQDLLSSNKAKAKLRQYASGELSKDVRRNLENKDLPENEKEELENKLKLLDKIESALNSKIKYPALEGMREESVLDAIFYAYNQKTGVVIADLSEHPKISSKMADLKGRVNKKGMSNLLNELKDDPEIQRRMDAKRQKGIEETEGEKAFAALLSGEKITRN